LIRVNNHIYIHPFFLRFFLILEFWMIFSTKLAVV